MRLTVNGISFNYNSRSVLNKISLEVNRGDCLAILGPNGVGKSTLLKCVNRILTPRKGVIAIDQEEVGKLSRREIAKRVGYVSQNREGGRLTVFDAVLLGRKPHINWSLAAKDVAVVNGLMHTLGLKPFSLRFIDELSGGELQKVVIARALAQEPKVLLLDEPTSNLDLRNQLDVLEIIKQIVKKRHLAVLVTMHDLNLALRFANKFVLLKEGSLFAAGGLEIITPGTIEQVYAVPVAVERFRDYAVVVPL
jgi:iron complex transport system ATP-binding protein